MSIANHTIKLVGLQRPPELLRSDVVQARIRDSMIRKPKVIATEPRRVVVELHPDDYQALEELCRDRRVTVPQMVTVVALRLARTV